MSIAERINIGPLARDFRAQGVPADSPIPVLAGVVPESEGAYRAYDDIKPELYALFAVYIDRVVGRSQEKDRLAQSLDRHYPFLDLGERLYGVLMHDASALKVDINSGEESEELRSVKSRLEDLLSIKAQLLPGISQEQEADHSISGGIRTGTNSMSGLLDILEAVGKKKSPQDKLVIAANTYPLIVRWSSMHIDDFLPFISLLQVQIGVNRGFLPFRPSFFEITGEGDRRRLEISERGQREVSRLELLDVAPTTAPIKTVTVGCPALVNFGDGSAIRKLWDWHLEIADRVYRR